MFHQQPPACRPPLSRLTSGRLAGDIGLNSHVAGILSKETLQSSPGDQVSYNVTNSAEPDLPFVTFTVHLLY